MTPTAQPFSDTELFARRSQRTFKGRSLLQIAMPLGGIGAGCLCLNGQGGLQDFSIRNNPAISAVADGHNPSDCAFATLYIPASSVARMIEGPMPVERVYNQGLKGQGYRAGGHEGFPRFRGCTFKGEYPFGTVDLSDPQIPLSVSITGFNPFIPLDDKNSSLPCAVSGIHLHQPLPTAGRFRIWLSHVAFRLRQRLGL